MTPSIRIALVLFAVLAFIFAWSTSAGKAQKPAPPPAWELTKVERGTEGWKSAQRLAAEGWEMFAVDVSAFYLKRPK